MTNLELRSKMACLVMTPSRNLRISLPTDNADDKRGYGIMTLSGKFMSKHLLVDSWAIQYRIESQLRNLVVLKSGILPFAMTLFEINKAGSSTVFSYGNLCIQRFFNGGPVISNEILLIITHARAG